MSTRSNAAPKRIAVVTSSRADYGYLLPIVRELSHAPEFNLQLIVSGSHLSAAHGSTVGAIEEDGFPIAERVEIVTDSDAAADIAKSIGTGVMGFADAYSRLDPDLLLLLGDRFEMLAAAAAMLPFAKPIAHIAGGESSEGAIDEAIRHSLTKMSHLHFVQTSQYRDRVVQMGEEPWRVTVSGSPSLDNLRGFVPVPESELAERVGLSLDCPPLLVTFHPVTLEYAAARQQIGEVLAAIEASGLPVVFTAPNADTNGQDIRDAIESFVARRGASASFVLNLGTRGYFSLMQKALLMLGNSSSGIIEAASFSLPVVNVGDRQRGRIHGENVIDVPCTRDAILPALRAAGASSFRDRIRGMKNPYGDGNAAKVIVDVLRRTPLDRSLLLKRFHKLSNAS
jgi:UDP-N-acetylglucosamine 2-epimerase (non-hydrolysing)/GDP/UDP-N,N'-diacetylbacillosamine 2-epimerase (hydrolysing)